MTQRNGKKSNRRPQNRNRRRAGSSGFEHEEDSDMISNIDLIEPLQSTLSFLPARPAKVTKRSHDTPMKTFPMGGVPVEFPFQPCKLMLHWQTRACVTTAAAALFTVSVHFHIRPGATANDGQGNVTKDTRVLRVQKKRVVSMCNSYIHMI